MAGTIELTREMMNQIFNEDEPHPIHGAVPTHRSDQWLRRAIQVLYQAVIDDTIKRTDKDERYQYQHTFGIQNTSGTLRNHKEKVTWLRTEIAKSDVNDYLWAKIREWVANANNGAAATTSTP
jgi:hypothetical protein